MSWAPVRFMSGFLNMLTNSAAKVGCRLDSSSSTTNTAPPWRAATALPASTSQLRVPSLCALSPSLTSSPCTPRWYRLSACALSNISSWESSGQKPATCLIFATSISSGGSFLRSTSRRVTPISATCANALIERSHRSILRIIIRIIVTIFVCREAIPSMK